MRKTATHRARYIIANWAQTEARLQVVEVIAVFEDKEPVDLTPLHDTIDRLLSELVSNPPSPASQAKIEVLYEGYRITVYQNGKTTFMKLPDKTTLLCVRTRVQRGNRRVRIGRSV